MQQSYDFIVIGSGVAGLMFALKVADHGEVAIITKKSAADSNTNFAQGGIAAVFAADDSFESHINDTLVSGGGLCHKEVVELVVRNGPESIRELSRMGVQFNISDREESKYDMGKEGGHSAKRIVHALDRTGKAVEHVLLDKARAHERIDLFENHLALDLITAPASQTDPTGRPDLAQRCCGVSVLDRNNRSIHTVLSRITLLATGGAGKVYLYTSNPDIATGDGIAMGYRAGATVANLEFVQFHPTCLYHPEAKNFLISEAVRGEGGILIDAQGRAFMEKYHELKDLACRDVVARAIDQELKKTGADSVFLDISHLQADFIKNRFPTLYERCLSYGMDMTRAPIPVVPAAHYICGGVVTDTFGRTDIEQLYAVGETACTGLHGANRLASNSLLEALVYADRAARQAIRELPDVQHTGRELAHQGVYDKAADADEMIVVAHNWDEIRRLMWNYVGIVRSDKRLTRAKRRIEMIMNEIDQFYAQIHTEPDLIELRNIATVADLIITSALIRKESRGLHYNLQYPDTDDHNWHKDTILKIPGSPS